MSLFSQLLEFNNLKNAWENVANNNGACGLDGQTIDQWWKDWEQRIRSLAVSVRRGTYKPKKYRITFIPKTNPNKKRKLAIPSLTDRILQKAAAQVLLPLYEPTFLPCSYAYRPKLGVHQAVQHVITLRNSGCGFCVAADIDNFFDSVDQELLLRFLEPKVNDDRLLSLIAQWLEVYNYPNAPSRGIAQGSPLSPLLANIYLNPFDQQLTSKKINLIRYADDMLVLFSPCGQGKQILQHIHNALKPLSLRLDPKKTSLCSFKTGFKYLGVTFIGSQYHYNCNNKQISVSGETADWLFSYYAQNYNYE